MIRRPRMSTGVTIARKNSPFRARHLRRNGAGTEVFLSHPRAFCLLVIDVDGARGTPQLRCFLHESKRELFVIRSHLCCLCLQPIRAGGDLLRNGVRQPASLAAGADAKRWGRDVDLHKSKFIVPTDVTGTTHTCSDSRAVAAKANTRIQFSIETAHASARATVLYAQELRRTAPTGHTPLDSLVEPRHRSSH
jgi:hypothetical protein